MTRKSQRAPRSASLAASPDEGVEVPRDVFFREADIRVMPRAKDASGEEERTIEIALSSETPVERYDWWEDERYYEVLDHSRESVDLAYAADGLPLLLDHRIGQQIGIIEGVRVDEDRVLRGTARFSKSRLAREVYQDVIDGIRKKISVGYRIAAHKEERESDNKIPTHRATRWMPLEGSIVPIPADYSVGVGRAADGAARTVVPSPEPASKARSLTVSDKNTAANNGAATGEQSAEDVLKAERKRTGDIAQLAKEHGFETRAAEWIASGKSVDEVARDILLETRKNYNNHVSSGERSIVEPSPRETRVYSLVRAIAAAASGNWSRAGYEREVHEEIVKKLGRAPEGGGFFVPSRDPRPEGARSELAVKTTNKGPELRFTEPGDLIELLRNRMFVLQMGARMLSGLQGNVAFPRQTGAGTFSWVAEAPGAGVSLSSLSLDQVTLSPKTGQSATTFSRQLLAQSVVDVESLVRSDIAAIHARGIDLAALHGTGASNQPTGVYVASGVNTVTFGGAIAFGKVVDMETEVGVDNADLGALAYITTPNVRGKAKQTLEAAASGAKMIWTGSANEGEMNGYRAFASNQVSKTLGVGSDHGLVFGNWNDLLLGEWGAFEILVDPYTLADRNLVKVVSIQMIDVQLRHPESFCKALTLTAA